jgi:hypothetical protein
LAADIRTRHALRTLVAFGFLFLGFGMAWPVGSEMTAMDRCADAGGSYDQTRRQCDFKAVHPAAGVWQAHGVDLLGAFACGLFGFILLLRRRR